jgi:hypothetical protein
LDFFAIASRYTLKKVEPGAYFQKCPLLEEEPLFALLRDSCRNTLKKLEHL